MKYFSLILTFLIALSCNSQKEKIDISTFELSEIPESFYGCSCLFSNTKEEYEAMDKTNHRYFILSVFERSPEWVYSYPLEKNLTVANAWVNGNEPILVIYNLK